MNTTTVLSRGLLSLSIGATFAYGAITEVLIDLNTTSYSGYPNDSYWNAFDAPADLSGTLMDSTGAATPLSISYTGDFQDSGSRSQLDGGPAWSYNSSFGWIDNGETMYTGEAEQVGDYFYSTNEVVLSLSGLTDATFVVDAVAGGEAQGTWQGYFSYSIDGGSTWTGFTAYNANGTVRYADTTVSAMSGYRMRQGVTLTSPELSLLGTDSLLLKGAVGDLTTSGAAFNGLRITADFSNLAAIPEPAMISVLMGVLAVALTGLRRRRR